MALTEQITREGVVGSYNMINSNNGTLIDNSPFNHNGVISNCLQMKAMWGEGLSFDGNTSNVSLGNDFIQGDALTIGAWIYPRTFGGGSQGRILSNSKTMFYVDDTNDNLGFSNDNSTYVNSASNSIYVNTWQHVMVTRNSSGSVNFYVNGDISGARNQNAGTLSTGSVMHIGNNPSLNRGFNGIIDNVVIWNRVLSVNEVKEQYYKGARQVKLKEDFKYDLIDGSTGSKYPYGWLPGTGVYKVDELTSKVSYLDKGTRYLVCNTAGVISIPCNQAYGKWSFDLYKESDGNILSVYSIANNVVPAGLNGYRFTVNANESIDLLRRTAGSSTELLRSNTSYISNTTWYHIEIERNTNGETTVKISGGAFGPTLILVSTSGGFGTNPVTDNVYTSSNYFVLDLDAGDRIANIKLNKGIIPLP
jgi:hypothetical protein